MTKSWFLTATAAVCFLAIPAQAAFEWIPPSQPANGGTYRTAPVENTPMASPNGFEANMVPMPEKQPLAPMAAAPAPVPAPVAAPAPAPAPIVWNDKTAQTTTVTTVTTTPAPLAPAPAPALKPKSDVIEGFGRDVPLTIATRQMVPSDYVVQYGQGVDPNTSVTWSGGRLWKDALMDSLVEKNMKATIVGDTVLIESTAPAPMPAPVAPPAPAPMPAPQIANTPAVADMQAAAAPQPLMPVTEVTIPSAADATMTAMATPNLASPTSITDASPSVLAQEVWTAPRASTLRQVLTDWCRQANVQLQWSAQYDYPLMSEVQIGGSFEHAVETLLSGLVDAQPRPLGRLHLNEPTGPAILVVETRYILE